MNIINKFKENEFSKILKDKKVLIIVGFILLIFVLILILSTKPQQDIKKEKENETAGETNIYPSVMLSDSKVSPTLESFSAETQKAIEEQNKADKIVGKREIEIRTKYPWFIKLPLRGINYFVYFDTNRKVFVGLLYPQSGDDTGKMKEEIRRQLKNVFKIPIENFSFEWKEM